MHAPRCPAGGRERASDRRSPLSALAVLLAAIALVLAPDARLRAQGVSTGTIRGTVRDAEGASTDGAVVRARNSATGFVTEGLVTRGGFLLQGLEPGGPYTLLLEGADLEPQVREGIVLRLGEPVQVHFVVRGAALRLDTLRASVSPMPNRHGGIATVIADSLVQRLPTLNRDFYDFVRLVPQISTKVGPVVGISGGAVGMRFNSFLVNGVSERTGFANATNALSGGKSLPLDAVREYQVLIAPYDVRYGDFAGAMVNTVTRSGGNRLAGSAFAYGRTDRMGRDRDDETPYERWQYGFTLGGPLVRDRLHFFIAPELQRLTSRAEGPYLGQPEDPGTTPMPVDRADVVRTTQLLEGYGLRAGSAEAIQNRNPLFNLFGRLDLALPSRRTRVTAWSSYNRSDDDRFSRPAGGTFPLSSQSYNASSRTRVTAVQVHTTLARSAVYNELLLSHDVRRLDSRPAVRQPVVEVLLPSTSGGVITLESGTSPVAQDNYFLARTLSGSDHLTVPLAPALTLGFGLSAERFRIERGGVPGSYGTWTFAGLDALARGEATAYELQQGLDGTAMVLSGAEYGAYAGSEWAPSERLSVHLGARGDLLAIDSRAPYNAAVDSVFGRRTDHMPRRRAQLSPRLGVRWDPEGNARSQLRGGIGVFTGRPPMAWYHAALTRDGHGFGVLECGSGPRDRGPPPAFEPDYRTPPTACANGAPLAAGARAVDLLQRDLGMAQVLRASLAYQRRLPGQLDFTAEALWTRNLADFVFVNLNLIGPQGRDRNGRVLYGEIRPTGVGVPALHAPEFTEVIELRNTGRNYSRHFTVRLERNFQGGGALSASYTHARARDVQTPVRTGARANWSSDAVFGRHEDLPLGISLNDIPHRLILAGTVRAPWQRWTTELAFYYIGEAGSPFTYRAWGAQGRGDLNADGSNVNDPIYVPTDVRDPQQIRFTGEVADGDNSPAAQDERIRIQQDAFDQFIQSTRCLRRQRGGIVERNSCREPWSHTTLASMRQAVPVGDRALELELQVYNLLNLLDRAWGRYRVAVPEVLEHAAQLLGATPEQHQPIFRFNATAPQWTTLPEESAYQLQLGVRYRF
jgi:hypothetical protein